MHPIRPPRVNPVGVAEIPTGYAQQPRRYPPGIRALAGMLLTSFVAVVLVTTAVSLGAYCLTSDTADTRSLPAAYLDPGGGR